MHVTAYWLQVAILQSCLSRIDEETKLQSASGGLFSVRLLDYKEKMADFIDPLTRSAEAGSESDDDDVLQTGNPTDEGNTEGDIFDEEGEVETTKDKEDADDLDNVIDLVKDGSLTLLKKKEKKFSSLPSFNEEQDLFITVENPEKVILAMETYVSYEIATKTTRSCFDNPEYKVRRRYQDFIWLRSKLEEDYPNHLIPPLPSKFIVKGMVDRFSQDFVGTRSRALDSFTKKIAEHPVISFSEHLKVFLTSEDFADHKKQSKPGILSRVGGTVKSAASVTSSMRSKPRDSEFAEMSDHVAAFREQVAVADRVAERLLGEEKGLVEDLKEYAPVYLNWASNENQVLGPIMTSLSKCVDTCREAAEKNAKSHETEFIPPLKEYVLYCDGIEQVFKRRDVIQSQKERCLDDLNKKKEEKGNLPATDQSYSIGAMLGQKPEDIKQQKELKLSQQVDELTTRYEESSDLLERANADLRSDMERWKRNKRQDMKNILTQLADSHISYQSQCLSAWESLIPLMQGKIDFGDLGNISESNEESAKEIVE